MPHILSPYTSSVANDCTPEDLACLRSIDAQLGVLLRQDAAHPDGPIADDLDFRTLWLGLLLGGAHCTSLEHADRWASYIRYSLDCIENS